MRRTKHTYLLAAAGRYLIDDLIRRPHRKWRLGGSALGLMEAPQIGPINGR